MEPISFPEANRKLTTPQGMTAEECGDLPVYSDGQVCASCWKPTWRERLSILVHGRVWLWVWSGKTQPPVAVEGKKTPFVQKERGVR